MGFFDQAAFSGSAGAKITIIPVEKFATPGDAKPA
jgi:hypothetical protein